MSVPFYYHLDYLNPFKYRVFTVPFSKNSAYFGIALNTYSHSNGGHLLARCLPLRELVGQIWKHEREKREDLKKTLKKK
jgi:hypothetical protein